MADRHFVPVDTGSDNQNVKRIRMINHLQKACPSANSAIALLYWSVSNASDSIAKDSELIEKSNIIPRSG